MNFGIRLPGPFRVGISSRGVSFGVTLGPFSVSTGGGRRKADDSPTIVPYSLPQMEQIAAKEGWRVAHRTPTSITIEHGRTAMMLVNVNGQSVQAHLVHTQLRARVLLTIVVVALVGYLGYGAVDAIFG